MKKVIATLAVAASFSAVMVLPASAADLENGSSQTCSGHTTWHFVNNQTGGAAAGELTAVFTVDGNTVVYGPLGPSSVLKNTQHFIVITDGDATLVDASTNLDGRLVLSDFDCIDEPKKDPKK